MFSNSVRRYSLRRVATPSLFGIRRAHLAAASPLSSSLYSSHMRFYSAQAPPTPDGAKPAAEAAAKPSEPQAKIEDSAHQVHIQAMSEKEEKIKELKAQLLYALADAENARKVAADDVRKTREFGIKDFAKDMVDVVDNLEAAVAQLNKLPKEDQEKLKNVATGINMTLNIMFKNLERHGVTKIQLKPGDEFDSHVHDALFNYPIKAGDTLKPGQVSSIVKQGYKITSRVLRPSQVGVAQAPTTQE
jgi:molecular chaperone GrpE